MSLPDESTSATITIRDVYYEVRQVRDAVAVVPSYGTQLGDHETRIRALERWRYSGHAALGVAASSLITAVTAILSKH